MAQTINVLYDPGATVHVITNCTDSANKNNTTVPAVRAGKIIRVRIEILVTTTKQFYDVQISGQPGTTELEVDDVFATLNDAVVEYQTRLA